MSNPYEIWTFTYDANGMRASRSDGNGGYQYIYNGSQLQEMHVSNHSLYFSYDANGVPQTVTYNNTVYQYVTNQQGDVIGIQDYNGNVYATYSYNAWGELISNCTTHPESIEFLNPLRYRGYVYDHETGLYYLQSRYYDPEIGRFLNADAFAATGQGILGNNMYAYCNNSPVTSFDPTGNVRVSIEERFTFGVGFGSSGNGVQGSTSNKKDRVDVTEKLNKAMIRNSEELYAFADTFGGLAAALYFVDMVKPGGDWDFKSKADWGLVPGKIYVYDGKDFLYDDIGNIHYGFVGRVLFSEDMLLMAGGVVQVFCGTSSWGYIDSNFDDPRDQEAIQFGCTLWEVGLGA